MGWERTALHFDVCVPKWIYAHLKLYYLFTIAAGYGFIYWILAPRRWGEISSLTTKTKTTLVSESTRYRNGATINTNKTHFAFSKYLDKGQSNWSWMINKEDSQRHMERERESHTHKSYSAHSKNILLCQVSATASASQTTLEQKGFIFGGK